MTTYLAKHRDGWWAYHPGAALPVRVDPNAVWLEGLEEMNRDRK